MWGRRNDDVSRRHDVPVQEIRDGGVGADAVVVLDEAVALVLEADVLDGLAALAEGGFSAADLQEIVLQQSIYCGAPAAHTAMRITRELLAEQD